MAERGRVTVPGSEKRLVAGAERLAEVHPDERVEVTVRVRRRAAAAFDTRLRALAAQPMDRREHLSREEYADQFGADPKDLDAVAAFARAHGLAVVERSGPRRSVVLSGTAAQMRAAFGVDLQQYSLPDGGTFRGREGGIYVPPRLAGIVEGVFGLDDRPVARPHMRRLDELEAPTRGAMPMGAAPRASFTPAQLARLYDFPKGVNGHGQSVAIIELGGGYRQADLQAYFQQIGVPLPRVVSVSVDHGRNQPTTPDGADGEVLLDVEVVGGVAPGATIVVYFAPNTDKGFIDAITKAVHDTTYRPSTISISWGAPEVEWTQAAVLSMDQAFQAAAAMGVTVYCAAGDNGANDFPPGPQAQPGNHADFPASSPHVVGCGGTHIAVANDAITQEVVWNDPGGGATGGGYSSLFPAPAWQTSVVQGGKRGVPDVAGDASPTSGYVVRVDGQSMVIGGTSAVAPLWAGLTALLNQQRGRPLGFANPVLYGLPPASGAFRDVTQGNNNGFNAAPGWDPCTGLGAPDGAKLLQALTAGTTVAHAG